MKNFCKLLLVATAVFTMGLVEGSDPETKYTTAAYRVQSGEKYKEYNPAAMSITNSFFREYQLFDFYRNKSHMISINDFIHPITSMNPALPIDNPNQWTQFKDTWLETQKSHLVKNYAGKGMVLGFVAALSIAYKYNLFDLCPAYVHLGIGGFIGLSMGSFVGCRISADKTQSHYQWHRANMIPEAQFLHNDPTIAQAKLRLDYSKDNKYSIVLHGLRKRFAAAPTTGDNAPGFVTEQ